MRTQNQQILHALKAGKNITALDGLYIANTMKLSSRCSELRALGHPIKTRFIVVNKKRIAQYWMPMRLTKAAR